MKTTFDAASLHGADGYKLLTGLVVPRPIGWIGTRSAAGVDNLAPYSFFNVVSGTPPTVLFAPGMRVRLKDTLANVRETQVFTVNIVDESLAAAMVLTSGDHPMAVDEFEVAGLEKENATVVPAPMVPASPANLECTVAHIHPVGERPSASVVFGEVVAIHVRSDLLDGTRIDLSRLEPVGRMAGAWYWRRGELFEMPRPEVT